jgi:hypothetical protein
MTRTIKLKKSEVPWPLLKAFPGYRGRTFQLEASTRVTLGDAYWGGGTRSKFVGLDLTTGQVAAANPAVSNPTICAQAPEVQLQPGQAIAEHIIFCGQDLGIQFYLHPQDVARLFPRVGPGTEGGGSAS